MANENGGPNDFHIPNDFIGEKVMVFTNVPTVQQDQNGRTGITFPALPCILKENHPGSILVQVDKEERLMPKSLIAYISRPARIAMATGLIS